MKVLIVAHDARASGGVNNFLRILRRKLRPDVQAMRFANGRRHGETGRAATLLRMLRDYLRFIGHISTHRYDVIHINPSFDKASLPRELLFLILARVFSPRSRRLLFYRGWDWKAVAWFERHPLWRRYLALGNACADRILVLSRHFSDALVKQGVPGSKIFVSTTMFEGDALKATHLIEEPRRPHRIAFLARFLEAKGGAELIRAAAALREEFDGVELIMGGDGPARKQWEDVVDELGLRSVVSFPGYIGGATKMSILETSKVFALPTTHAEGLPNAVLEAMAAGCAIVTTGMGGIEEVVEDGRNGAVMPNAKTETIIDAISALFRDPARLQAISDLNREVAWKTYESAIVARRMAEHYRALTGTPPVKAEEVRLAETVGTSPRP